MSKECEKTMPKAIGLDVGTSCIVAARQAESGYRFDSQLNAFINVPFSRFTQNVFEKEKVPHRVEDSELLVFGNESEKLANVFNRENRRPMTQGVLNPEEPEGISVVREIVEALVGRGSHRGQKICFSVPGPPLAGGESLTYHEAALRQLLEELGFAVSSINEGLAVVYAELEDSSYTGVGVSCGGGMCNVCLAYLSVPVFSFSIPKAGDYIDAGTAAVTGEKATRVRVLKEASFHFNGHFSDKVQQALGVYYEDVMRSLASGLSDSFVKTRNLPRFERPVPLVISGGSALPEGFRERFERMLEEARLPLSFSEVRLSGDPLHSTAKGALVAALAEG